MRSLNSFACPSRHHHESNGCVTFPVLAIFTKTLISKRPSNCLACAKDQSTIVSGTKCLYPLNPKGRGQFSSKNRTSSPLPEALYELGCVQHITNFTQDLRRLPSVSFASNPSPPMRKEKWRWGTEQRRSCEASSHDLEDVKRSFSNRRRPAEERSDLRTQGCCL
jgi:hypothetical protein